MRTTKVETYTADIYCGLRAGYYGSEDTIDDAVNVCRKYCDEVGLGLTVRPTRFVYTDGQERGVVVGLINYPRFPSTKEEIRAHAEKLVEILMEEFFQQRISVVYPDETVMYEAE